MDVITGIFAGVETCSSLVVGEDGKKELAWECLYIFRELPDSELGGILVVRHGKNSEKLALYNPKGLPKNLSPLVHSFYNGLMTHQYSTRGESYLGIGELEEVERRFGHYFGKRSITIDYIIKLMTLWLEEYNVKSRLVFWEETRKDIIRSLTLNNTRIIKGDFEKK